MNSSFAPVTLRPFAARSAAPLSSLVASGSLDAAGRLELDYQLRGGRERLRLPAGNGTRACAGARRDELWLHTCLELFARAGDSPGYLEFNFAPDGDWAAYGFDDYRAGQQSIDVSDCLIRLRPHDDDLQMHVSLLVPLMAATPRISTWHLGVAAVIEADDGSFSYWALNHPQQQPDFHDPAGFTCALRAPAL